MQYGMIGYYVPQGVPRRLPLRSEAAAAVRVAGVRERTRPFYLMCITAPEYEQWFREAWRRRAKKLDMGKSCVRFKKLEDVALDVIGEAIRRAPAKAYIEHYESVFDGRRRRGAGRREEQAGREEAREHSDFSTAEIHG